VAHKEEIDQAIIRALDRGRYVLGGEVAAFEREFAHYLGTGHVIGVGSGTDALQLALRACGVGRGDMVITVSHTAVATVAAIELVGAVPVLVDIDRDTFTIDPGHLEACIRVLKRKRTHRLKAIIPVHLYGHPADMPAVADIAERHELCLIEDCAQSHGATVRGRKTGTWGRMSAFSFYPTKNLGALGDGGAVATADPDLAEKVGLLRQYGWRDRYISELRGMNSRLDELQATILRVKLKYLDRENARRRELAHIYTKSISSADVIPPRLRAGIEHVYHQYVVRSKYRDELRTFLERNSIGTLIHYPLPVHRQPAYQGQVIIGEEGLAETEQVCKEILSLPIYPEMTDEQVRRVCEVIALWHERKTERPSDLIERAKRTKR